jgi:hypothetical protein
VDPAKERPIRQIGADGRAGRGFGGAANRGAGRWVGEDRVAALEHRRWIQGGEETDLKRVATASRVQGRSPRTGGPGDEITERLASTGEGVTRIKVAQAGLEVMETDPFRFTLTPDCPRQAPLVIGDPRGQIRDRGYTHFGSD